MVTGLHIIEPTTTTGSSGRIGGRVPFSNVREISLNGVFSSLYDKYAVTLEVTSTTAPTDILLCMRAGGWVFTQPVHMSATLSLSSNVPAGSYKGAANGMVVARSSGASGGGAKIELQSPALPRFTYVESACSDGEIARQCWGTVKNLDVFDGFSLMTAITGPVLMSGVVQVYGYQDR